MLDRVKSISVMRAPTAVKALYVYCTDVWIDMSDVCIYEVTARDGLNRDDPLLFSWYRIHIIDFEKMCAKILSEKILEQL